MELPSLPTDRLYKVYAVGGLAVWLGTITLGIRSVGALQDRVDATSEALAALEVDAAFANDSSAFADTSAGARAELRRQRQELARQVAVIAERGTAFKRDLKHLQGDTLWLAINAI
jgi:hypothetical protein